MLDRLAYQFIKPFPYWRQMFFFKRILYIFLLLNALSLLPIAYEIYGYHGIVGVGGWNTGSPWYQQGSRALINLLSHPYNANHHWVMYVFVYGQILALFAGIFNFWPKMMSFLIYFFTANLFLKGYLMFTGGEALVSILLFYLIFVQNAESNRKGIIHHSELQNLLNNTFYWIILIQICFVYFFSTLYKLTDSYWLSGEALMYISRVDAFSSESMRFFFADQPVISLIGTYIVLIYQGLFSIVVWIKPIKMWFLGLGVLIHLGIAFGMGIFTFGIIMCLVYLPFLDDEQLNRIQAFFRLKWLTRE